MQVNLWKDFYVALVAQGSSHGMDLMWPISIRVAFTNLECHAMCIHNKCGLIYNNTRS